MLTVPITVLEGSDQARDIAASKGPSDIWQGKYRVKQYVKDDTLGLFTHPNTLEFPQPYQAAAEKTGCTWTEGNRVFSGQMHGCNIACPYCYVGCNERSEPVTAVQYFDAFGAYNDAFPERRSGVCRISGGEPLMTPDRQSWVAQFLNNGYVDAYTWVDTNLTTMPDAELADAIRVSGMYGPEVGFCGCLKPGIDGVDLRQQIDVARALIAAGADLYLYWPSWGGDATMFADFLAELEREIPRSPLRLTVIHIKWGYAAVRAAAMGYDPEAEDIVSAANLVTMRQQWQEFCAATYPRDLLWLPSQQVELRAD